MQGRQHEVTGQRGLDRDDPGLSVADLADQDDVGVLAQDRPQRVGEGEPGLRVRLHLVDVGEPVLDRILDRDDVARLDVEQVEGRVERGRLARPGRPGDQDGAVRLAERVLVLLELRWQEAEARQRLHAAGPVEDSHDDLLAVDGRQRGDAQVDHGAVDGQADPPVLRHPSFGDVDVGHHLQARDDAGDDRSRLTHPLVQHPVDAVADSEVVLGRLDVDVGGSLLHGLQDDQVDELDDRGFLDDGTQRRQVLLLVERIVDHDLGDVVDLLVELATLAEQVGQLGLADRDPCEPLAEQGTKVVDGPQIARRDHADDQFAVLPAQRHGLVLVADVLGEQRPQGRITQLGAGRVRRSTCAAGAGSVGASIERSCRPLVAPRGRRSPLLQPVSCR